MSNEAAERLWAELVGDLYDEAPDEQTARRMARRVHLRRVEIVATERKATVERIRTAAAQVDVASHGELSMHDLDAILDAEAARG